MQKKFIIDRSKWRCGGNLSDGGTNLRGEGITYLLNNQGFMCCLGQVAKQCGVDEYDLLETEYPYGLDVSTAGKKVPMLLHPDDGDGDGGGSGVPPS